MRARPPRAAGSVRAAAADKLKPDDQVAHIGAGGAGVHQVAARRQGARRVGRARQWSASSSASATRAQVSASTSAPASSVTPSLPSVPAASSIRSAWPAMRRAAASARCWLRPPRPGRGGSATVDSPPHTHSCAADRLSSCAKRAARRSALSSKRRAAVVHGEAERAPALGNRRDRLRRRAATTARCTWSAAAAAGPISPEPMTAGSSCGTSEMNSARAARPPRRVGEAAALDARDRGAPRVELADRNALASAGAVQRLRDPQASRPRSSTSTRLEAPPEIRNSGCTCGRQLVHPGVAAAHRRASERSSGSGMCAGEHFHGGHAEASSAALSASRVMMSVRSMAPPSASWAPCAMAAAALPTAATHSGAAARGSGARKFLAHTATAVDAGKARLQQLEQQGAPRVGRVRQSSSRARLELAAALAARELGGIRALQLQPLEVLGGDVAGHVLTGEAGGIELLDARILVLAGGDQVVQILVDEPVGADEVRDLVDACGRWRPVRWWPACRCRRRWGSAPAGRRRRNTPWRRPPRARAR